MQQRESNSEPHLRRQQQQQQQQVGDSSETVLEDELTTATKGSNLPKLLTPTVVHKLAEGLDAGDVLECYLLRRKTYLHHRFSTHSLTTTNNNNTTGASSSSLTGGVEESTAGMIPIQTTALGLRYRPPRQRASSNSRKRPLTLTLEYGPNRAGRSNSHLSVPTTHLFSDDAQGGGSDAAGGSGSGSGVGDGSRHDNHMLEEEEPSQGFMTWENQGQVYYTTYITPEEYLTANFIASLTGAVLGDLLQTASSYPEIKSHRRYQPWEVVNATTGHVLLKSSSDYDFVYALMERLAEVGVELSPVLNPVAYRLQLQATGIRRHAVTPASKAKMVSFYHSLYHCLENLATATSVTQQPTLRPTVAPSTTPQPSSSGQPTQAPSLVSSNADTLAPDGYRRYRDLLFLGNGDTDSDAGNSSLVLDDPEEIPVLLSDTPSRTPIEASSQVDSVPPSLLPYPSVTPSQVPTILPSELPFPSVAPSFIPSWFGWDSAGPTSAPHLPSEAPVSHAAAAAEAAAAAQQAAEAVDTSDTPEKAAEAAKQAATAAQKAAHVTANQQASLRQEALMAGTGTSMAQTASLCLSDPVHGIAVDPSVKNSTTAYLYWDSTFYFEVETTAPYISVVPIQAALPRPPRSHHGLDKGTFVDWSLVVLIFALFAFGLLMLLQQILGRNFRIIRPLYKFQRWFFDPLNHHYEDLQDGDEAKQMGGGQEYSFGQDAIPFSMGGVRTVAESVLPRPIEPGSSALEDNGLVAEAGGSSEVLGDVELISPSKRPSEQKRQNGSRPQAISPVNGSKPDDMGLRFRRDPELVELPDLTSTSKVAVPVSLQQEGNRGLHTNLST